MSKALNGPPSRWASIKYPRNTPRISRKRKWYDRSEWRKDSAGPEASTHVSDATMGSVRKDLGETPYGAFPGLLERAARSGMRKP